MRAGSGSGRQHRRAAEGDATSLAPGTTPTSDAAGNTLAASCFALALGIGAVGIPLLAADRGFSTAEIGIYIASSAVWQLALRVCLPWVMRRHSEALLILTACVLMSASCAVMAAWASPVAFLLSQMLIGLSRACYFTGSQTQAVRFGADGTRRLAVLSTTTGIGLVSGPVIAGVLGVVSLAMPLVAAAALAAGGAIPASRLTRHPRAQRPSNASTSRPIWRASGVILGSSAALTSGVWRAMLNAYVPVALQAEGAGPAQIGVVLTIGNGAAVLGAAAVVPMATRSLRGSLAGATLTAAAGLATFGFATASIPAATVTLFASGVGAGALQTIGPSVTVLGLETWEKGSAIAIAGTYRAGALLLSPLAVAGALSVMSFAGAMAVLGAMVALPVPAMKRLTRASDAGTLCAELGHSPPQ